MTDVETSRRMITTTVVRVHVRVVLWKACVALLTVGGFVRRGRSVTPLRQATPSAASAPHSAICQSHIRHDTRDVRLTIRPRLCQPRRGTPQSRPGSKFLPFHEGLHLKTCLRLPYLQWPVSPIEYCGQSQADRLPRHYTTANLNGRKLYSTALLTGICFYVLEFDLHSPRFLMMPESTDVRPFVPCPGTVLLGWSMT
jgi:hypothetical protein